MKKHVIGIDLGGTKTEACLIDNDRNEIARDRVDSEPRRGTGKVIKNIVGLVNKISKGYRVSAIGIGTPGTYLHDKQIIYGVPHTQEYEESKFIPQLIENFDVPVIIDNDANCLALAEFFAAYYGKYEYVMAVILGTGMGSGLILDNKLYHGAKMGAGEIGHTSIDIYGRQCQCGRQGCGEAYLSGPSLARRYSELTGKNLKIRDIYNLYQKQEPKARILFDESCEIMAQIFANAVNYLDLEAIILGGGISNLGIWYDKVPQIMQKSLFGPPRKETPIIKAKLGDSAGVFGAAYLALREIGEMDF